MTTTGSSPKGGTKGERTRARLVDVAARVFADRGYATTSFGDLIEAAGVSKGAFYFHFISKDQLALAVLEQVKEGQLAVVRGRVAEAADPARALRVMAETLVALDDDQPATAGLAHELASSLAASPELRDEAAAVTRRWLDLIAGVVGDGQRAGQVRADLDPDAVAALLFGAVDGARRLAAALEPPERRAAAFARQLAVLVEVVERGLLT